MPWTILSAVYSADQSGGGEEYISKHWEIDIFGFSD